MNVIMHNDEKNTLPAAPATPSLLLFDAAVDNLLVALEEEEEDAQRTSMVGCLMYEVVGTLINILGACCFGFGVVDAR